MGKVYFTLTGTQHYYGKDFLKKGMKVRLIKEPENEYDREAIRVELPGLGKIGYVANSTRTVLGESMSAREMIGAALVFASVVAAQIPGKEASH